MAKFKITVTRTDEYEIEVDEKVWTTDVIQTWGDTFWGGEDIEDVAKLLAVQWMKQDGSYFKEGFGFVKELNSSNEIKGVPYTDKDGKFAYPLPVSEYAEGLSIKPIVEDEEYDVEVENI